jgi:hypothetical protein
MLREQSATLLEGISLADAAAWEVGDEAKMLG